MTGMNGDQCVWAVVTRSKKVCANKPTYTAGVSKWRVCEAHASEGKRNLGWRVRPLAVQGRHL